MKRRAARWGFAATALVAVVGTVLFINREIGRMETGEDQPRVEWLPASASRVSYFRSFMWRAYEFDIDERSFRDWADVSLTEIAAPVTVPRYRFGLDRRNDVRPPEDFEEQQRLQADHYHTVEDGMFYEWSKSSGARTVYVYDRRQHRGYFYETDR